MTGEAADGEELWERIWLELGRGVVERSHAFHTPVLATTGPDGRPEARMVVLRRVRKSTLQLQCHADARSPKVASLRHRPEVCWLFYLPEKKWQLRIRAAAEVLQAGDSFEEAWAGTSPGSRRCYLSSCAPGAEIEAPHTALPPAFRNCRPTKEDSEDGRKNFAVIQTSVRSVDFLALDAHGHLRGLFQIAADGSRQFVWVAP